MKKMMFGVISLVVVFSLAACKNNKETEKQNEVVVENNTQIEENKSKEIIDSVKISDAEIKLDHINLKKMKEAGTIPASVEVGQYYEIGKINLSGKEYVVQFVKTVRNDDPNNPLLTEEKIILLDNDEVKLELLGSTDVWYGEFIKDFSSFKGQYLVTVSDTNTGDSMQFISIYDKNLKAIDYLGNNGAITVHQGYENYYTVGENEITFIYTDGQEKVTSKIVEKDGKLAIEEVERTSEGVKEYAGRT